MVARACGGAGAMASQREAWSAAAGFICSRLNALLAQFHSILPNDCNGDGWCGD